MFGLRKAHVVTVLFIIALLLSPLSSGSAGSGPVTDHAGGPRDRIEVVLQADGAPRPGGTATLTLEATPLIFAPNLKIRWIVPDGVELLGEATDTYGAVEPRQTVLSQRQVRFPRGGMHKIAADASFRPGAGIQFAASGVVYFEIDARGSRVSDMNPDAQSPMHSIMQGQVSTGWSTTLRMIGSTSV